MASNIELSDVGARYRTPMIHQSEAGECGLACLGMVAGHHGYRTDLLALRRRFSLSLKGTTLRQLMDCADMIGLISRPLRGDLDDLDQLTLPAILHWDLDHYVVLVKRSQSLKGARYQVHDPAHGRLTFSREDLSRHWTGVALEIFRGEQFAPITDRRAIRISHLWSSITGLWGGLRQLLVLSIVLQVAALAGPFYLQTGIDTALPAADKSLLYVLALGFGGLAVIEFVTSWLRSLVLVHINNSLSYQVVVNLFRHLLSLPLGWFEKRHVGDVISRFGSTIPITQLLSAGMMAAFIDGAMAVLTFILMVVYSPVLAAVAVCALAVYVGLRFGSFQAIRARNINSIATLATEQTAFIETVRGIATIKGFGQEANRLRLWQSKKADALNAGIQLGRLNAGFDAFTGLVIALERVVFVYFAVHFAFDGSMTVGMIFAFQAYKQQFLDSGVRVVAQVINLTIVRVHLARVSDIALSAPEDSPNALPVQANDIQGNVKLEGVGFTYGLNEPAILRDVDLEVKSGEMIALIGPSGGGKTTLMKVMMGLFEPTTGHISVDGIPLASMSKRSFRSLVGSVAQSDILFSGTISENIAMFAPDMDFERVEEVARIAGIHDEIQRMALGYNSLVGDMGSVLSGGQRQRVLLARALYGAPRILFMDEGTANLDEVTESLVLRALRDLPITRIVIAHRPQAIAAADRVFYVDGAQVRPVEIERKVA